jgi:hypothetical protein
LSWERFSLLETCLDFWKINENTDWEAFQTYLKKAFELSPLPVCNNVNTIWETWKNNIDNTANHIIGALIIK